MIVQYLDVPAEVIAAPLGPAWNVVARQDVALTPTPLAAVEAISPLMALSRGHGKVRRLTLQCVHDRVTLTARLAWRDAEADTRVADLDRFVDGAAILFPLTPGAQSITMGDADNPVNGWFWRADRGAFDVVAHGFGSSRRRDAGVAGLTARAEHDGGGWRVTFQRALRPTGGVDNQVALAPGGRLGMAFAVWEGGNRERAGQKAFSGDWLTGSVAP